MYLPDTLLVKVDIASMAVSLETRAPLLDTAVMEFAAALPRPDPVRPPIAPGRPPVPPGTPLAMLPVDFCSSLVF